MTDEQREKLIDTWRSILEIEPEREMKDLAQMRMRKLISERSFQQIEQMERERGLR